MLSLQNRLDLEYFLGSIALVISVLAESKAEFIKDYFGSSNRTALTILFKRAGCYEA